MNDAIHTSGMDDGLLVRYLDGEADRPEIDRVEAALADPDVAVRLERLREAGLAFAADVGSLPAPPPPALSLAPRRRRWLPAAAVVALLVGTGVAAAVPVTRALIVSGIARVVGWTRDAPAPPPLEAAGATVTLTPSGAELTLEVEGPGQPTTLRVSRASGSRVEVAATGAELLVLPDGVRVRGAPAGSEPLEVAVPPRVLRLRIRVGTEERLVDLTGRTLPVELRLPGG